MVTMVQALAKHIEQLVALPDELRETTIRRYKRLCDSCGCHNERELAAALAEERRPRACPLARLPGSSTRLCETYPKASESFPSPSNLQL